MRKTNKEKLHKSEIHCSSNLKVFFKSPLKLVFSNGIKHLLNKRYCRQINKSISSTDHPVKYNPVNMNSSEVMICCAISLNRNIGPYFLIKKRYWRKLPKYGNPLCVLRFQVLRDEYIIEDGAFSYCSSRSEANLHPKLSEKCNGKEEHIMWAPPSDIWHPATLLYENTSNWVFMLHQYT